MILGTEKCLICGRLFFAATMGEAMTLLRRHLAIDHYEEFKALPPSLSWEERLTGEDITFLRRLNISPFQ